MTNENTPVTVTETSGITFISDKDFNKGLETIKKQGLSFRESVHGMAMQALFFAYGTTPENGTIGDCGRMTRLYTVVQECTSQRNASQLRLWFEAFAPTIHKKNKNGNEVFAQSTSKDAGIWDFEKAHTNPWYTIGGFTSAEKGAILEEAFSVEDLLKGIQKQFFKMKSVLRNEQVGNKVLHLADIHEAESLREKIDVLEGVLNSFGVDTVGTSVGQKAKKTRALNARAKLAIAA